MNLAEAVERYFQIDVINHEHQSTAGSLIYFLMEKKKFQDNNNYINCYNEFLNIFLLEQENQKYKNYKQRLVSGSNKKSLIQIDDIDLMSGYEFEYFISNLFNEMGYKTEVTKASGDQGIDVVCEKNGMRLGIQAKCYVGAVGNSAVQEVVGGKIYYNLDKVMVITNSIFTKSALDLAKVNDVVLWDRSVLLDKLK